MKRELKYFLILVSNAAYTGKRKPVTHDQANVAYAGK